MKAKKGNRSVHTERALEAEPRKKKCPTPRTQFNLTRKEIAELLVIPGVQFGLQDFEVRQYRALAAGNMSEAELAAEIGMKTGEAGVVEAYISPIETRVIRRALYLGWKGKMVVSVEASRDSEGIMENVRADDARAAAISGGTSIGGSIINTGVDHGKDPEEGSTFKPVKALDSFEHGGTIRREKESDPDQDDASGVPEHDDYSEDSRA
jgi:hypothetical protein